MPLIDEFKIVLIGTFLWSAKKTRRDRGVTAFLRSLYQHTPSKCGVCYLLCLTVAGDGVLWSRLNHRPGEEHKERPEGRLDRLYFTRDPESE